MKPSLMFVAALPLSLAGCVVGPNYHVPEHSMFRQPSANGAFTSGKEAVFAQAPLPDHWWHLYDDARLDAYITEALRANTDLRAADANLRRATFVVREAQAGRFITTTISGGAQIARVGGYTLPLPGLSYSYSLGAGISYPLDLAGGIRRGIEAAKADSEATQAARDQVRVTVAAAVARSYVDICSANTTLAATQRVLAVQGQTLDVTRRLATGGRSTAFDVTRAEAAVHQSAAAIPTIAADRQAALYELAALMGRAPEDYPREAENCANAPELKVPLPIGDGSALIRRRPDIRAAERNLAAATATIGVEMAQLYPQVSIGGSFGAAGPFSHFLSGSSLGGALGPLVNFSFPNRAVAHARIQEAGAAAEAASAQFDGTVISALQQTETSLDDYAREIDRDRELTQARDDAAKATDQANRLYKFGRTSFIDVLTSQANLANAEAALATSHATLVDRQINVFLALGGGWHG